MDAAWARHAMCESALSVRFVIVKEAIGEVYFRVFRLSPVIIIQNYLDTTLTRKGPGSVVGIVTGYGLDGPRIESR